MDPMNNRLPTFSTPARGNPPNFPVRGNTAPVVRRAQTVVGQQNGRVPVGTGQQVPTTNLRGRVTRGSASVVFQPPFRGRGV